MIPLPPPPPPPREARKREQLGVRLPLPLLDVLAELQALIGSRQGLSRAISQSHCIESLIREAGIREGIIKLPKAKKRG